MYLSCGKTGFLGRELDVKWRKFCRLAGAAQRGFQAKARQLLLGLSTADLERRPHGSRGDRIDPDALFTELLGQ
jgi:hypothetical protein